MSAILFVRNFSFGVHHFPLLKFASVQINPDETRTFPVSDLRPDFEKFLNATFVNDEGVTVPSFGYGYYDPASETFDQVMARVFGDGQECTGKVDDLPTDGAPSVLDMIRNREIITEEMIANTEEMELRRICYMLGTNPGQKQRPGMTRVITECMTEWAGVDVAERHVMDDESVTFQMISDGWIESDDGDSEE